MCTYNPSIGGVNIGIGKAGQRTYPAAPMSFKFSTETQSHMIRWKTIKIPHQHLFYTHVHKSSSLTHTHAYMYHIHTSIYECTLSYNHAQTHACITHTHTHTHAWIHAPHTHTHAWMHHLIHTCSTCMPMVSEIMVVAFLPLPHSSYLTGERAHSSWATEAHLIPKNICEGKAVP